MPFFFSGHIGVSSIHLAQGGHEMIEIAHTARMQNAFDAAHTARGQALVTLLKWLFGARDVPLNNPVLTEPSRCA